MTAKFRQTLLDAAVAPYRSAGSFAWHFARGKLSRDPIFIGLLERGVIPNANRFVDLGCGQGLLVSWLLAARELYDRGLWADSWPAPPKLGAICGVELMPKDIDRARAALGDAVQLTVGDFRNVDFGVADVVVIMDALHYMDYASQEVVLRRVRAALQTKGVLVTRVGDAAGGLPFRFSNWVDHTVTFVRGHRLNALYCRTLQEWKSALERLGFAVETTPMYQGMSFNNFMLVARLN